mgnify:CR=1 FL=1
MDVILPIFSQRLKQLRRDRKITQKAMAELLGKPSAIIRQSRPDASTSPPHS